MNRSLPLTMALAAIASAPSLFAQAAAARPAAAPEAMPAKIALIAFEQAVVATNEGQRAVADVQKKYAPQKAKIDSEASEVTSLQNQIKALPASTPDEERATRERNLDTKEKELQRDEEDASNSYQGDLQEALSKVSQKVGQAAVKYAQENGYTLMLNVGGNQQTPSPILWALPSTDITQAVINAYNTSSGIAAPPPSAPTPSTTHRAPGAHQ